jgi:hypothetical protein
MQMTIMPRFEVIVDETQVLVAVGNSTLLFERGQNERQTAVDLRYIVDNVSLALFRSMPGTFTPHDANWWRTPRRVIERVTNPFFTPRVTRFQHDN